MRCDCRRVASIGTRVSVGISSAVVTTRAGAVASFTKSPDMRDRNTDMASRPLSACRKWMTP